MTVRDAFSDLEAIYADLPDVPCVACGLCCVTPHITFVEFAHLLDGMLGEWTEEEAIRFVARPMEPERRYPGNHKCGVQSEEKGLCSLYEHRPLMCRLEGMPILDRMAIREVQICPYITEAEMPRTVTEAEVDRRVREVFDLAKRFYPVYEEPYWLTALNVETWLALVLDPDITQRPVLAVRRQLRESFDLDFLEPHYVDRTGLARQLDLIDCFFEEAEVKRRPRYAVRALQRILNEFPATGSYWQEEGRRYLDLMRKVLRQEKRG